MILSGALALLACLAGALAAWFAAQRNVAVNQSQMLDQQFQQAKAGELASRDMQEKLRAERDEARTKQAVAEQAHRQLGEQFTLAQQQLKDSFKSLAGDALAQSANQFLQLARKTFEGEQKDALAQLEQRKQAVEAIVKPVGEALEKYNASMQQIEQSRNKAYGELTQQVATMMEDQRRLRQETGNLVRALRRPEVRGRWGELQLRRVAELAGMIDHCDFTEQASIATEEGHKRPDMVVTLPSNRVVVIDAKTPLDAFLSAMESNDDMQRQSLLEQHAQQIEKQVKHLASKAYTQQFTRAADFVVLFIPGESFLFPAMQHRPELIENAMNAGVVIATPTTLISLLKVIALGWREEQVAQNAQRISEVGRELHNRLCTAVEKIEKLGGSLDKANQHYNELIGSLESRVFPQARRFEEFGAASSKRIPAELPAIDTRPRQISQQAEIGL